MSIINQTSKVFKELTVDFPIDVVLDKVSDMCNSPKDGFKFTGSDSILKIFTFSKSEFLSLGASYEISVKEGGLSKTVIGIEATRNVGSFDHAREISYANTAISDLFKQISNRLNPNFVEEVEQDPVLIEGKSFNFYIFLLIFFGILGVHKFYVGKTSEGVTRLLLFVLYPVWFIKDLFTINQWNIK